MRTGVAIKEKFLLALLFTFSYLVDKTEQGGIFGAPKSLYDSSDHVVILNTTNIKPTIYGTKYAWVVEFYSSWCGHCINFAPVYKQFAAKVKEWQSLVKIAVIDCADEANIPTCREYEIMGYPSIRFFPPFSPEKKKTDEGESELNHGDRFPRSDKVSQLRLDLMDLLTPHFPSILGEVENQNELTSMTGVWNHIRSSNTDSTIPSLAILIFEGEKSTIGKEVALDLSSIPEMRVLRFQKKNHIYKVLGFNKSEWPAAGYVFADLRSGIISIPKNKDIVSFLRSSAMKLATKEGLTPSKTGASAPPDKNAEGQGGEKGNPSAKQESNLEEPAAVVASNSDDVVSLEDLIHAVRNSLRNEVGMLKIISGSKLTVLKQYVHTLGELFPADRREMAVFLKKLDTWLDSKKDKLDVHEYLDKLTELELEFQPWDIDVNTWATCSGSVPGRRGYTCSLWRLFHSLTILATQKSKEISVLPVIHGYVKEFFGCSECVQHFTKMVADENALGISTVRAQALWLWKAHNKVNLRLKGSASEDPGFPKGLYPSENQCSKCHVPDKSFDEEKVFDYLGKIYTNPVRTMKPVSKSHGKRADHEERQMTSRFFSGTDYWIFCIVYLSVAALLIFGYIHFKLGYRRRLDPLAICRKFIHSSRSMV